MPSVPDDVVALSLTPRPPPDPSRWIARSALGHDVNTDQPLGVSRGDDACGGASRGMMERWNEQAKRQLAARCLLIAALARTPPLRAPQHPPTHRTTDP